MNGRFLIWLIFISCLVCTKYLQAQKDMVMRSGEQHLTVLQNKIKNTPPGPERVDLHEQFAGAFLELLARPGAFIYPFDSLTIVYKLDLPGTDSRLFSWDFPSDEGFHEFHGILITRNGNDVPNTVAKLIDVSISPEHPETSVLTSPDWYGAVYYQAVPFSPEGFDGICFLLLGWKGISNVLASRVMDVLAFEADGTVHFGKPFICLKDKVPAGRVVFKYSASSSMVLKYEVQSLLTEKKWNDKKRRFDYRYKKTALVVADRLVPQDPQLAGQYEFYIASADVVDGFVLEKECWKQVFDIDARNPSENQSKSSKVPVK